MSLLRKHQLLIASTHWLTEVRIDVISIATKPVYPLDMIHKIYTPYYNNYNYITVPGLNLCWAHNLHQMILMCSVHGYYTTDTGFIEPFRLVTIHLNDFTWHMRWMTTVRYLDSYAMSYIEMRESFFTKIKHTTAETRELDLYGFGVTARVSSVPPLRLAGSPLLGMKWNCLGCGHTRRTL